MSQTHPKTVITSAPGKIILHGEHAVVHGTTALAASLNLRSFMQLTSTPDIVSLSFPDLDLVGDWKIEDIEREFSEVVQLSEDSFGYLDAEGMTKLTTFAGLTDDVSTRNLAVIAFLYLYICIAKSKSSSSGFVGLTALATSNLPTGAGLGSSAAFSASLAAGLLLFCGAIRLPTEENPWTKSDRELINRWAYEGERVIHGNPSGIDNAVSVFGGALSYKGKVFNALENMPSLKILLVNTKVPRSTKVLVAGVKAKLEKYPRVIRPVFESIEEISNKCQSVLKALLEMGQVKPVGDSPEGGQSSEELYETLEDLIDMNQSFLKIIGVSHPAVEHVCSVTSEFDVHSKLTGAGGGGCVFAIIRPSYLKERLDIVMKGLEEHGYDSWVTSIGGPGVAHHANFEDIEMRGFILPKHFSSEINKRVI